MKTIENKRYITACMAMQGIITNPHHTFVDLTIHEIVKMAYEVADEMIEYEDKR